MLSFLACRRRGGVTTGLGWARIGLSALSPLSWRENRMRVGVDGPPMGDDGPEAAERSAPEEEEGNGLRARKGRVRRVGGELGGTVAENGEGAGAAFLPNVSSGASEKDTLRGLVGCTDDLPAAIGVAVV